MSTSEITDETLDFIYQHVVDSPERQLKAADSADSKLVQVFAAASIVLGVVLATRTLPTGYVIAVAVCYALAAGAAGYGLWTREFKIARYPAVLWNSYRTDTPRNIKIKLVRKIAKNHSHNCDQLHDKARALQFVVGATALEALIFALGIIFGG